MPNKRELYYRQRFGPRSLGNSKFDHDLCVGLEIMNQFTLHDSVRDFHSERSNPEVLVRILYCTRSKDIYAVLLQIGYCARFS